MKRRRQPQNEKDYEDILIKYYFSDNTGYLAADKFYKKLKDLGEDVPLRVIKEWLARQPSAQDTAPRKKPVAFNSVVADYVGQTYQMDIMYMRNYQYAGYEYILLLIDVHSRYWGWAPLKTKYAEEYTGAFRDIIKNQMDNIWPEILSCDREFVGGRFKRLLDKKDIDQKLSERGQPYKNAIVERLVRSIRNILGRWRAGDPNGGADWVTAMAGIRQNLVNTQHRTIKQKPIEVWYGDKPNNQTIYWVSNKLGVGDHVRVLIRDVDKKFTKADDLKWGIGVYRLVEQIGARWKLGSIPDSGLVPPKGLYMEYELKKVEWDTRPRPNNRIISSAQTANAAVTRRLVREDLGAVSHDVGGRPTLQLTITEPRVRRQTDRFGY
jgi:hypothetical protein